jgi:hypothetical protein
MNLLLGCLHGLDGSGTACWNDGSCEREQEYGERGQHDYGWVERIDLKEQVAQQAGGISHRLPSFGKPLSIGRQDIQLLSAHRNIKFGNHPD